MNTQLDPPWYETFFTDLPNEFWRRAAPAESAQEDVRFAISQLELRDGAAVLDVPCGSGRHCLAFAAAGHRVTGYDISAEAIAHARGAVRDAGADVQLVQAEMRTIPQTGAFDAAVCLGNSIGYLPERELRDFLAALAGAVRPGGGFMLDYNAAAESLLPGYSGESRTMETGDITVESRSEYDVLGGRALSHYRFMQNDRVLDTTAVHHVYTCGHLVAMLEAAGFTDIACFDGVSGRPFTVGAGRLVCTGRRS